MTYVHFQLPEEVERGVLGGPKFKTSVFPLEGGFENRNIDWIAPVGEWDAGYGLLRKFKEDPTSMELDLDLLKNAFYVMQGKGLSFLFQDWSDFEIGYRNGVIAASPQTIALGDDDTKIFQLFKQYEITLLDTTIKTYVRPLTKFQDNSLFRVFLDATELFSPADYTMDFLRGLLTLVVAPASTGGSGPSGEEVLGIHSEFFTHVRFNTDKLDLNMRLFNAGSWPSFPLIELRRTGLPAP